MDFGEKSKRLSGLLVLLLFNAEAIHADNVYELQELVVTGTRTEKPLLDVPVRTEVVSSAEIEKTHARDLKEALANVPGLLLKDIHGKSGYEVWLQGLDSNRVLVMIDGEPITPSTGSTVDLTQISTADIKHIEIVKGATSALYGSSAMGGVINVITRKPEKPLSYSVTVDGGSYGDKDLDEDAVISTRNISGKVTIKQPEWYLDMMANQRYQDGFDLDKDTYVTEGAEGDKSNINLRLAHTPDENTRYFIAPSYYHEDLSNDFSTFLPGVGDIERKKREDAERVHTSAGFEHSWENGGGLSGTLVADNWHDITQQDVVATTQLDQQRTANMNIYRAEFQWDQPLGEDHLLTTGILFGSSDLTQDKEEQGVETEEASGENRSTEMYFQDDIFVGEHWELLPGIRLQDDSDFGFETAPKINAMYSPDWFGTVSTNLRIGYGKGYRVPNLKERFYIFDHSALGYMVLGNPDLIPEQSDSYQIGIEFVDAEHFHFELGAFHNRIENLIDTDFSHVENGIQIFNYQNIARAMTQGIEGAVKYRFTPRFSVSGSITFLDSEDLNTGNTLTERPARQIKLGLDYEYMPWGTSVSLRGVHQSEEFIDSANTQKSPAWTTLDLKINQALSTRLTVFAGIDNLTDEHRDPALAGLDFSPLMPRFIYAGVRFVG